MPYLKINQDDAKPTFEVLDLPDELRAWLAACYNALGCSTIQTVPTVIRGLVLVIDDEVKLWDGWLNRINKVATILYGTYWDPIVGDAILARDAGDKLAPLTSVDVDRLGRFLADFCITPPYTL